MSGTLFGQTGSVGGFSLGGAFILTNPFITNTGSAGNYSAYPFLSSAQQSVPTEGYLEYQYSHIIQADVGWIGINNSPFLAGNYYSDQSTAVTYQGALFNINPGGGWLITALGINGAQYPGVNGFTGLTLYNPGSVQGIPTGFSNDGSPGSLGLGVSYYTPENLYNFRVWGYQFENYADMVYADTTMKFPISDNIYLSASVQGGAEWGQQNNAISNYGLGDIQSNFAGAQFIFNYNWFNLTLGYENIWGPQSAFGSGALVSPYTYNENVDPLYGNSWMTGLVQKASSGQMYIISPTFSFLNHSLTFAPAYSQVFNTATAAPDQELDFVVNYYVPQVKGLKFFAVYAYMFQPPITTNQQTGQQIAGSDSWTTVFTTSYLY